MRGIGWWLAVAVGCGGGEEETDGPGTTTPTDSTPPPVVSSPVGGPVTPAAVGAGQTAVFTVTGLDDTVPWRVTLVLSDYVDAPGDGTGTFQDGDANGAADPGSSEFVARIVRVGANGYVPGQKTVPNPEDDPANPTGVYPVGGVLEVELEGVGTGSVRPVAYHNGGASTFLELDDAGTPIEPYVVGGELTVDGPPPSVAPVAAQTIAPDGYVDYTLTDVSDLVAYRVTLVVADNVTPGPDQSGTFVDLDANGYADAGASEAIALITQVNGADVAVPAKTVPDAADDPADPTGVYPVGGVLTVRVTGVASGTVHPVAYVNGGATTFLEVDGAGSPIEDYAVGGALTVD